MLKSSKNNFSHLTKEYILENANKYGLTVEFGVRDHGFYVNGEKVEIEDFFPELEELNE